MPVTTHLKDGILEITVDNPPVNALSHAVRAGLCDALREATEDLRVKAVVIDCAGRTFFAGADITEFGVPPVAPTLPNLCDLIELMEKPVVAAIHGTALGGGLEIALACHYRIGVPSAKLGTPEVKLGLLPGAGGTQRLPRLVGAVATLDMIVSGSPISASKALELGLLNSLAGEGNLIADALAFAHRIANIRPLPRTGERPVRDDLSVVADYETANSRKFKGQDAPQACLEAIRAAITLPLREGLALERTLFQKLVSGEQSAALRHVFFAERRAGKVENLPEGTPTRPVTSVGVVGAGTMGTGIAMVFLSVGLPVVLLETSQEALERGLAMIKRSYDSRVAKGRISAEARDRALALLVSTLNYEDLGRCDLIIEAVFELMEAKRAVFARLDAVAKADAILATNTSYLDVNEIAGSSKHPERVLGLHFFSPANIMKLLEVVRGEKTSPDVLATGMALAKRIGKIAVVSGVCYGFIGNRILARRRDVAIQLLLEGATPQQIDDANLAFGMPMGPFQMSDLAGVDIGWHREPERIETIRDALCAAGRFGQKAGKGYYDYDYARRASPSQEVNAIIEDFARKAGQHRREISSGEILERSLYAMIDEGARILADGIAQRASDIDVVWINGYGWPAYKGGPMYWAGRVSLGLIVERLKAYGVAVSPYLTERAVSGGGFGPA